MQLAETVICLQMTLTIYHSLQSTIHCLRQNNVASDSYFPVNLLALTTAYERHIGEKRSHH